MSSSKTEQDALFEDPEIHGQRFVLLSFISEDGKLLGNAGNANALKVRGCFSNQQKAQKKAEELRELDPDQVDIYVAEIGKWLPWFPKNQDMEENYAEKILSDLVNGHREEQEKAKKYFEEDTKKRKELLKRDASVEGQANLQVLGELENTRTELNRDLTGVKHFITTYQVNLTEDLEGKVKILESELGELDEKIQKLRAELYPKLKEDDIVTA